MIEVIPAILPKNYEDLKNKISLVKEVVSFVQIDICDGVFVPSRTWPFSSPLIDSHFTKILNEEEGMPFWEDVDFELDLMVSDAVENFDVYTKLGAKRIVFHIEAMKDLEDFKNFLEAIDPYIKEVMQIGVAINPNTPIEKLFSIVNNIDFVQFMGIAKVGYQGEPFYEGVLNNIKIFKEKFPELIISVDGGVNLETGLQLKNAGADRLISGSAIFNTDDIIGTIESFKNL